LLRKPLIAQAVTADGCRVLAAVQLDGEPQRRAVEVQDVVSSRMLATEACAIDLRASQLLPQASFNVRNVLPKFASAFSLDLGSVEA
jgi:hypothetical protein